MTNTKFRKRALLSSIAMLLVALVALGSATFAWFTTNPDSTTQGMLISANASLGLVISSESEQALVGQTGGPSTQQWTHKATFRASSWSSQGGFVSNPSPLSIGAASLYAGSDSDKVGKIYTVVADNDNNYAAKLGAAVEEASAGTDYYAEELNLKVTGQTSSNVNIKSVSFNVGSGNLKDAVRVAIFKKDGTLAGIWGSSGAVANEYLTDTASADTTNPPTGGFQTSLLSGSSNKYALNTLTNGTWSPASGTNLSIGTIDDSGSDSVLVVVYLDGQDSAVYSSNINTATGKDLAQIINNVVIDFKAEA